MLARAVQGKLGVKTRLSAEGWELYSDQKGVGAASTALSKAAKVAVDIIRKTSGDNVRPLRAYLEEYCWRITFTD